MNCKKCGTDVGDSVKFCPECGAKIQLEESNQVKKPFPKRKVGMIATSAVLVAGIAGGAIFHFTDSINTFERQYKNGEIAEAKSLYKEKIQKSTEDKKEVTAFLQQDVDTTLQLFIDEKISFEDAIKVFNNAKEFDVSQGLATSNQTKVEQLNFSRKSFALGKEYAKQGDIEKAATELKRVIETDKNYAEATKLIKDLIPQYKTQNLKLADEAAKKGEFDTAVTYVEKSLSLTPEDAELIAKKEALTKQKWDKLKNEQQVIVVSTGITTDFINDKMAQVIIQNKTKKTVKKYEVSYLAYDRNGYPVQTGWVNKDYEGEGFAEQNVQPNEKFGSGYGWDMRNNDVAKIIAIVRKAEFYDGSSWENEYYPHWKEQYYGKPLK